MLFVQPGIAVMKRRLMACLVLFAVGLPGVGVAPGLAEETMIAGFSPPGTVETVVPPPAEAGGTASSAVDLALQPLTFGSQAVLERCWSRQELEGSAQDKGIVRAPGARSRALPAKLLPENTLRPLRAELQQSIRRVEPQGDLKLVALTFDLCEGAGEITGYDADIINTLRRNQIKATFFAGGKWLRSHPEKALQLMADPLFEIGNHGWAHRNFRLLDIQNMSDEVLWTQAQYELLWEELVARPCMKSIAPGEVAKIPKVPRVFRFPYGTCTREALALLARSGLPAIQWNVVTGDAAPGQKASLISREILEKTRPGSIIIGHANGRGHGTAEALSLVIPKLRQAGYNFVTISELLASGTALAVSECYETKPGDNIFDMIENPAQERNERGYGSIL